MGKDYDQLDLDDRIEISRLHAAGKSLRVISRLMGRATSTISRELQRNSLPKGEYKPASVDRIALSSASIFDYRVKVLQQNFSTVSRSPRIWVFVG